MCFASQDFLLCLFCAIDDWRVDGYRWYQYGTKSVPRNNPEVKKIHFGIVLPSSSRYNVGFRRQAFFPLATSAKAPRLVLIHYIGDESIAVQYPHGNSHNKATFHRTYPSVIKKLALATSHEMPGNVYKKAISTADCPVNYQPHCVPRNLQQVSSIQHHERQKNRLTHDAIYNLHELSYDLGSFVRIIKTYPDLMIICGLDKIVEDLNMVLKVDSDLPQLLSYDTTFQLGDFFVSPLLYRQVIFTKSPVIPALFLVHERKFQGVHEQFMHQVSQLLPYLVKGKKVVPLVTDEEVGIFQVSMHSFEQSNSLQFPCPLICSVMKCYKLARLTNMTAIV
jgi:hypothetical protein